MPTKRSNSMDRSRPSRSSFQWRGRRNRALMTLVLWCASAPTMTFSSAVISGNSRMFWKVRAMPMRVISCFLRPVTTCPRKRIWPAVGWYTPVMALKQVVLPAPFGPISPKISPSCSVKLTWSRARTPPNRRETLSTSSSASGSTESRGSTYGSLTRCHLLGAVLQLHGPPAAGDEALWPQDHDQDDHDAEDHEPPL